MKRALTIMIGVGMIVVPVVAHLDTLIFGRYPFEGYLFVCFMEYLMLICGFLLYHFLLKLKVIK